MSPLHPMDTVDSGVTSGIDFVLLNLFNNHLIIQLVFSF